MNDQPSERPGPTREMSQWLAESTLSDVPPSTVERAKYLLLDGLGCALVGSQLPESRRATGAVAELNAPGSSVVIGWNQRLTASGAALLNGTFIQGFELDDYHPTGPLHSCSVVIPALLGVAGSGFDVSDEDFLLAAVLGLEVGPRVGHTLNGAEMLTRGWHSGSVFGPLAAASAAGKLLGLDAASFEDALGLAATQAGGLMAAQYGAMSKRMHHGFAARSGLYAATLANHGYTGIKQVFEVPYGGYLSTFGEGHAPQAERLTEALGQVWELDRICVKPYATMGGLHGAIDAIVELADQEPFNLDEIASIEVLVSEPVYHHGGWEPTRPLSLVGAQMNMAYGVAVAVLDGTCLVRQFAEDRIDSDDVWSLIERITVGHDPELDEATQGHSGAARVAVRMRDGRLRSAFVPQQRGGPGNALSNEDVRAKFRTVTSGVVTPERAHEIARLTLSLGEGVKVSDLLEALAGDSTSPL